MEYYKSVIEGFQNQTNSKSGLVNINLTQSIYFSNGIIGFPGEKVFCLIQCPIKNFQSFVMLQSVNNPNIRFIVLPLTVEDMSDEKRPELLQHSQHLGINSSDLKIYFIVTSKTYMNNQILVANIDAPVFIDYKSMNGIQSILPNGTESSVN